MLLISLLACSTSTDTEGPPDGTVGPPSTTDTAHETAEPPAANLVTAADGGVAQTSDGRVTVEVPPGAVQEDTTLTIEPAVDYPDDPGLVPGSAYTFGPDGLVFLLPVTVTIAYDEAEIPPALNEDDLRIHTVLDDVWTLVSGATVDTVAHTSRAEVSHFSVYGVRAPVDDEVPAPEVVVASAGGGPESALPVGRMMVFEPYVYWTTGNDVNRAPTAGGPTELVTTGFDSIAGNGLTKVGSTVFFATGFYGTIYSVPETGGDRASHAGGGYYPGFGLTTDGTDLYWPVGPNGNTDHAAVVRTSALAPTCAEELFTGRFSVPTCPPPNGSGDFRCPNRVAPEECTTQVGTGVLAVCCDDLEPFGPMAGAYSQGRDAVVADGYLYWAELQGDQNWIRRKALAGGAVETLATDTGSLTWLQVAVGGGRVYWSSLDGYGGHELLSVAVTGGPVTTTLPQVALSDLVADADHLYLGVVRYLESGIYRIPHAGGEPERMATTQDPGELDLTATQVYYVDRDLQSASSSIRRIEK